MYIMLCFLIFFLGYIFFGIAYRHMNQKLGLTNKTDITGGNILLVITLLILCGTLFLTRMIIPYLSSHQLLWITMPKKLTYVDKTTLFQCSFDYLFLMMLILIGWIDYEKQIIPNYLNGLILILGIFMQLCILILPLIEVEAIEGLASSEEMISEVVSFPERMIGLLIISVPIIFLGYFYKGSFGMGDVKFLVSAGFFMGWKNLVMGAFLGSAIASIVCIISLVRHKMDLKDKIAFGPYLCMGMALIILLG